MFEKFEKHHFGIYTRSGRSFDTRNKMWCAVEKKTKHKVGGTKEKKIKKIEANWLQEKGVTKKKRKKNATKIDL